MLTLQGLVAPGAWQLLLGDYKMLVFSYKSYAGRPRPGSSKDG